MQVALHFGAPYTDENRLQLCLGKNREMLAELGTAIPRPAQFRKQLRPLMSEVLNSANPLPLQNDFLHGITGGTRPSRIIFSADNFLGFPRNSINQNEFLDFGSIMLLEFFHEDEFATFVQQQFPKLYHSTRYQVSASTWHLQV